MSELREIKPGVEMVGEDSYVTFIDEGPTASGKTRRWTVMSESSNARLGRIAWYGGWRRYCFYPRGDVVFSAGCLIDVAAFIQAKMEARK